jgi:hypothetical protein
MDSIKNQLRKNGITKKNAVKLLWRLQFPQSYWKNKDNIYLVYTMGKVGSTTIQETLEKTLKVADIFHIHTLSDQRLEKSRIHFPEAFRRAKKIKRKTKLKKRIKIITVTRDPIAKKISGLFQNPWLYGLNEEGITQLTPQELCNIIKNNLDKFYDALTWFDEEFFNFTGIDIYTEPFDFDLKKETISQNNIDVLALRLEDFKETEIITAHLSYFVGQPIQQLINRNQTQTKKFKELYKKTLDMIELPEDFIQEIYSSKYCTHFYTPTEIHQFRAKWTKSKN